jgi:hypothetical protein
MLKKIKTIQDFQKLLLKIVSILLLLFLLFFISKNIKAQIIISTNGVYTQDFGNTDITSWINNSTFLGWYSTHTSINHENITNSAPTNTGGFYSYECNGNNDQKIGSRPSNSVPGAVGTYIRYGVRFINNSGQTITRIRITFTAFQFSLAENDGVINSLEFHYRISNTAITNLTSGTYTSVPQLWYQLPNNDTGGNSNQLLGYPCTVYTTFDECLNITINHGEEIMLRWSDRNDANNDHHNGIDDVTISFYTNTPENSSSCVSPLPITLSEFSVKKDKEKSLIQWTTISEINNDYFVVERSNDAENFHEISKVKGAGNSNTILNYQVKDYSPLSGTNYYRLKQVDFDGSYSYSEIKALNFEKNLSPTVYYYDNKLHVNATDVIRNLQIEIYDVCGKLVYQNNQYCDSKTIIVNINQNLENGIYIAIIRTEEQQNSYKFVISK